MEQRELLVAQSGVDVVVALVVVDHVLLCKRREERQPAKNQARISARLLALPRHTVEGLGVMSFLDVVALTSYRFRRRRTHLESKHVLQLLFG